MVSNAERDDNMVDDLIAFKREVDRVVMVAWAKDIIMQRAIVVWYGMVWYSLNF